MKNGGKMKKTGSRKSEKEMAAVFHAVMISPILVYHFGPPIWPPEINKNIWSSLFP